MHPRRCVAKSPVKWRFLFVYVRATVSVVILLHALRTDAGHMVSQKGINCLVNYIYSGVWWCLEMVVVRDAAACGVVVVTAVGDVWSGGGGLITV